MPREVNKLCGTPTPASGSFNEGDDIDFSLCLNQNTIESPDSAQKKLLCEIRKLTLKVSELENFCDDCESEKQEILQIKLEQERMISSLDEKCRAKDRELIELQDAFNDLRASQMDSEKLKEEFERLKAALKSSQETNESVEVLQKENAELIKKNITFNNRIRLLETEVSKWKTNREWKVQYEQVKDALEKAEKELFEFVKESERTKAVSEMELMDSQRNHPHSPQWATISRARCTCTCHHTTFRVSKNGEDLGPLSNSIVGAGDSCSTVSPLQLPESTQNMDEISVVDVSLWRDTRTSSTQSDVTLECLGEIMAHDIKIQDLQNQLNVARNEMDRLNVELSQVSTRYADLSSKCKLERENLDEQMRGLNLEKEALLTDLEEKCVVLEMMRSEISTFSLQLKAKTSELTAMETKSSQLKDELDRVLHELDESEVEKVDLRDKVKRLECESIHFLEKEKELEEVNRGLEGQLNAAQAEMRELSSGNKETIAVLEVKIDDLTRQLSETQNQLKSDESLRIELSSRLYWLQEGRRPGGDKVMLPDTALSADDFGAKMREVVAELEEKISLVEHLKMERAQLIEARTAANKEVSKVKSELSQAWKEVARLSNELNETSDNGMRIEQLESSLRTRDANIASLNQLICENDAVISRLTEERNHLEKISCALKVDLEAQTSTCTLLVEERDKTKKDYDKRTQEMTDEKNRIHKHTEALERDLVKLTGENEDLSNKCTAKDQELLHLQQQVSSALEEIARLSKANQCLIDDNAKLAGEKAVLKQAIDEESSLVTNLRDENDALTTEVAKLKLDLENYQRNIVEVYDEKSTVTEKLETRIKESIKMEIELADLRDQLALVTADQKRLVGSNAKLIETLATMKSDRSQLENQISEMRRQYVQVMAVRTQCEEDKNVLEENLKRLRTNLLTTEQGLAEARQAASVAILHRQFAENECSRLIKFIEGLQLRLDSTTTERLACEERMAAEAVRCRQLEGALNEKATIISGLQHQLYQLDAQRKKAQEMETSTFLKYLNSKVAQDEAKRRLALIDSSTSLIEGKRSFDTSYHLSHDKLNSGAALTTTTAGGLPALPLTRRHSDISASRSLLNRRCHCEQLRSDINTCSPVGERRRPCTLHFGNERTFTQSPLFGDALPLPHQDAALVTLEDDEAVCLQNELSRRETQEPIVTSCSEEEKGFAAGSGSSTSSSSTSLHIIHNKDLALSIALFDQETDAFMENSWSMVSPIVPQVSEQPPLNNVTLTTKAVYVAETVGLPRCASASSDGTSNTDTDMISELEGWPPYSECAAPLSPQALRGNRIFTVPTPFEFHYRRLRRLLVASMEEETDTEMTASCLEEKAIPRDALSSFVDGTPCSSNLIVVVPPKSQNQISPKPMSIDADLSLIPGIIKPRGTFRIRDASKFELCALRGANQTNTSLSLSSSQKPSPNIGACGGSVKSEGRRSNVDRTQARYTSTSRPTVAKLARFQSAQKLCDLDVTPPPLRSSTSLSVLSRAEVTSTEGVALPQPNHSIRGKFGKVRGRKTGAGDTLFTSAPGVKLKKHNKLRLSNVFKSKKNKPYSF
ncbi:unnamed protein product [Hydatigera taeniaeformis]|uniref:GRIP domain-containing protein n=1 Tax=Hydatigena taeniaeformis TaxID=6205 RepID=A0A0R3X5Q4_HYDTA|nr:unnamed protein product [Hydatigera taeniaeformis]